MRHLNWTKLAMALTACTFVFTACDDDDDHTLQIPEAAQRHLTDTYGNVGRIDWEVKLSNYYVADFRKDGQSLEAWYTTDGVWKMTETELGKDLNNAGLPEVVKNQFLAEHADKRVDDIDRLETAKSQTYYIIEVEPDDYHVHYNLDGTAVEGAPGNQYYDFYLNK